MPGLDISKPALSCRLSDPELDHDDHDDLGELVGDQPERFLVDFERLIILSVLHRRDQFPGNNVHCEPIHDYHSPIQCHY